MSCKPENPARPTRCRQQLRHLVRNSAYFSVPPAGGFSEKRLYFSCISKKSTQKKERKGGHPLFHPPLLSRVHTIQPWRPKPAYSGTPAPTAVPQPGVATWQGPRSAPSPVRCGKPLVRARIMHPPSFASVGADALIGPFPPGVTSPARNIPALTPPCSVPRGLHPIRGPAGPLVFGRFKGVVLRRGGNRTPPS